MFQITKRWRFDAAHHLDGLVDGHKCARVHGHTWTVEVTLAAAQLAPPGFVTDFGDLTAFGEYLATAFDHRDLNTVVDFPPTSERLAEHLAAWFMANVQPGVPGRLTAVRVSETPSSWAEYLLEQR
jgi:6-pyruvoyltetrahydropterin/6-carboxytetrahydropterin synthase